MSTLQLRQLVDGAKPLKMAPASKPVAGPLARLAWEWATDERARDIPDELIDGLLVRSSVSILFGDSNSGKTFLALDIAAAIARGVDWFDRKVESGLVIYLASESPSSPRSRLYAYRVAFQCETPNLIIVTSPVDLFASDADMTEILEIVDSILAEHGKRCELIICDTLARVSAGANENSGEDMGLVIRRVDALREKSGAHVMLIHHTGKDAAKGARGWSGLRAAVDTEIEITADEATGIRVAEVTKQRDLPGKGDRIGFKLDVVNLGTTKWGKPFTSCVVIPADAPQRQGKGRRLSEIAGAILELLEQRESGVKKSDIAKHFADRYDRASVYREIKKLVERNRLIEAAGVVQTNPSKPFVV
jgi:putative DNA primase/helicase